MALRFFVPKPIISKPNSSKLKICRNFLLGICKEGHYCCDLHPIGNIPKVCSKYLKDTFCEEGVKCKFLHLPKPLLP